MGQVPYSWSNVLISPFGLCLLLTILFIGAGLTVAHGTKQPALWGNLGIAFAVVPLLTGIFIFNPFVPQRDAARAAISEAYGLDLSIEQINELAYPIDPVGTSNEVYGSTEILMPKAGELTTIEIFLVLIEGKLELAEKDTNGNYTPLPMG